MEKQPKALFPKHSFEHVLGHHVQGTSLCWADRSPPVTLMTSHIMMNIVEHEQIAWKVRGNYFVADFRPVARISPVGSYFGKFGVFMCTEKKRHGVCNFGNI